MALICTFRNLLAVRLYALLPPGIGVPGNLFYNFGFYTDCRIPRLVGSLALLVIFHSPAQLFGFRLPQWTITA